ncbi:MAG TPA: ATP-binding protein [Blastocatellia bacterium]|jgi:PAS domain S-box-containing protein
MLKTEQEQVTGHTLNRFIDKESLADYEALINQAQKGDSKGEILLVVEGGATVPAYFSLSPVLMDEQQCMCGIITDMTEHKRTQELIASERLERSLRVEAEASRQRVNRILESITDAFLALDHDWRITDVNQRMTTILGKSRDEIIGHVIWEMCPETVGNDFYEHYQRAKREQAPVHFEEVSCIAPGRWFEVHAYPVEEGLAVYFRDITDRKQVEQQREQLLAHEQKARKIAEEANQLKDDFLATLSHEMRTPLNAIIGWADLLKSGERGTEFLSHAVEVITRNAKMQSQLIEDILDVSRIIAGKFQLDTRLVELVPIIDNTIESARPSAEAKGIRLTTSIDSSLGVVFCDPVRLQQAVWNLLANAIKFTPRSGQVEVSLERDGASARLSVKDTGEGISPEFLPYVFDRFRQNDSSYARKHSGLGLGLAIAHHIVQLHGGTIEAHSEGEGQGATFTIRLPLASENLEPAYLHQEEAERARRAADQNVPRLVGLQVLIVEDDPDMREALGIILKSEGASIKVTATVKEGFEVLESWKPDVLVSDIGMPGEDGFALIEKLRLLTPERGGQIPAIALTGYAGTQDGDRVLLAGFQKYLAKPAQLEDLIEAIAGLANPDRSVTNT